MFSQIWSLVLTWICSGLNTDTTHTHTHSHTCQEHMSMPQHSHSHDLHSYILCIQAHYVWSLEFNTKWSVPIWKWGGEGGWTWVGRGEGCVGGTLILLPGELHPGHLGHFLNLLFVLFQLHGGLEWQSCTHAFKRSKHAHKQSASHELHAFSNLSTITNVCLILILTLSQS